MVGPGSTAATTALIQYEVDTHLVDPLDRVGADHAVRSYRLCVDAVRGIEQLAGTAGDGCGWRSTKSLYEAALLDERDVRARFSFTRRFSGSIGDGREAPGHPT